MPRLIQQSLIQLDTARKVFLFVVQNGFWRAIFPIELYANPTLCRRLGVDLYGNRQFAYQKAESRFDNYPVRAIIRDERF